MLGGDSQQLQFPLGQRFIFSAYLNSEQTQAEGILKALIWFSLFGQRQTKMACFHGKLAITCVFESWKQHNASFQRIVSSCLVG